METTKGQRLKVAREHAKLTQQAVANHFGVEKSTVYRWEADRLDLDVDRIVDFTALCGFGADVRNWIAFGGDCPSFERDDATMIAVAAGASR